MHTRIDPDRLLFLEGLDLGLARMGSSSSDAEALWERALEGKGLISVALTQ